jgi:hypothetical protein
MVCQYKNIWELLGEKADCDIPRVKVNSTQQGALRINTQQNGGNRPRQAKTNKGI